MNIFSTILKNKQKTLIIAGSLLFGLALTPMAANADQNGKKYAENNNGHHHKHVKRGKDDRRYYVVEERRRANPPPRVVVIEPREEPRYVIINNEPRHPAPKPAGLEIGVHTGLFDIVVRD